jgi:parvulin-like peptidyl-prolyl isomerase
LPVIAILIANPGCHVPVGSDAEKSNASPSAGTHSTIVAASDPNDTSPVDRLTVNSDTVTAAELWWGLREELATKANTLSSEAYKSYVEQQTAQLIGDKIAEMLLYQRASLKLSEEVKSNIDKHVDREIRRIVTSEHDGIQRRYEKHLESRGQTLAEVREKLRREVIIAGYLEQEVRPKVAEPTRTELLEAFQLSADSLRRPPRRSMSLIDVRVRSRLPENVTDPTPEQLRAAREEAMSRIRAARDELQTGADFAEVARRYSDGLNAADGGSWGWVTKGSVRERFEPAVEALYKLNAGQDNGIIEAEDGFFLVRCDELDPGLEPDFQTVQPELKERHFRAAYNRLIIELVADLRSKARIEPANLERFHTAAVNAAFVLQPVDR